MDSQAIVDLQAEKLETSKAVLAKVKEQEALQAQVSVLLRPLILLNIPKQSVCARNVVAAAKNRTVVFLITPCVRSCLLANV